MKLESLKMNLESLKSQVNNEKNRQIKGKITKSPKIITNTTSLLDLEFIQIACSLRGRAKSPRPRRQAKKARRRSYCYVENVFGRQRRYQALQLAAVEWVVWIHSIIKNKPNFKNIKIGISSFETSKYEILPALRGEKTNPIKPNSNPISKRPKMNANAFSKKDYKDIAPPTGQKNKAKTNPIQTQYKLVLECFSRGPDNLVGGSDHTDAAIDFPPIKAIICKFLNLFNNTHQKTKTMKTGSEQSKLKSLFLASRPNFLAASAAPVLVGSTLGYAITGSFNFGLFILALIAIMALQAGANMANDYFDHISGNDWANKNVTPFSGGSRYIQQGILTPRTVLLSALVFLAVGSVIGLIIVLLTKSLLILVLGLIGLLGGFFYTAPPIKLGYRCVGEFVIALLFGLLPVFASYYLQTGKIDIIPLLPAGIVAILIFLIILINEFPDLAADAAVNKKTLIVRLGVPASVWIYRIAVISGFIFAASMLIYRSMFFAGLLYLLTLPVAVLAVKSANKKDLAKPGQFKANQITVLMHTSGSLALTIGFIIIGLRNTAI